MKNTHKNIFDKLDKITSKEPSKWLEKAKERKANAEWLKVSKDIALNVLIALKVKGMSQKHLADILQVSPQQVSKIVKGQENLTLETICKIQSALDIKIITKAEVKYEVQLDFIKLRLKQILATAKTLPQKQEAVYPSNQRFSTKESEGKTNLVEGNLKLVA